MNQKLFTLVEVALLGGLVVFVMYIGGAFKGRDPAPTPQPTATPTPVRTAKPAPTRGSPGPSAVPSPTPTTPPITEPTGLIAFESNRDGNSEIYVVKVETGIPTNLTNNPADDYSPLWSPDGSRLAFFSTRTGWLEIYAMNADGSDAKQLTNTKGTNTAYSYPLAWSPDGEQILALKSRVWYVSQQPDPGSLDLIQTDGSGAETLYQDKDTYVWQPSWSPDGNYVAILKSDSQGTQLYLGKPGETPFSLSGFVNNTCYNHTWSPDGKLTCFTGNLMVVNPGGTNRQFLTDFSNGYPTTFIWSPTGQILLYVVRNFNSPDPELEVYVVNADGSGQRGLVLEAEMMEGSTISFSPDGQWLAYNSKADGLANIHIVNVYDPAVHSQLTIDAGDNFSPQWQPRSGGIP